MIIKQTRWSNEPWVWFNLMMLGFFCSTAAIMTTIAIMHTPAEIDGRWYQDGALAKMQKQQLSYVNQIHLQGDMSWNSDNSINIKLSHENPAQLKITEQTLYPDTLNLYVEHASSADLDDNITLTKNGHGSYTGKFNRPLRGKYFLLLSTPNNTWHLNAAAVLPAQVVKFST